MTENQSKQLAKKIIAMHYYLHLHISLGYCAQIAELSEEDFISIFVKIIFQSLILMVKNNSRKRGTMPETNNKTTEPNITKNDRLNYHQNR